MTPKPTDTEKQFSRLIRERLKDRYGYGKGVGTVWAYMGEEQRALAIKGETLDVVFIQADDAMPLRRVHEIIRACLNALPS